MRVASLQCGLHLYNAGCGLVTRKAHRNMRHRPAVVCGVKSPYLPNVRTNKHTQTNTHAHAHQNTPTHPRTFRRLSGSLRLGFRDFGDFGMKRFRGFRDFGDFGISGCRDAGISGFGITVKGFGLGGSELGLRVSESAHPTVVIVTRTNHQPVVTFGISPVVDASSGSYLRGSTA
jgi:hypothetical protein